MVRSLIVKLRRAGTTIWRLITNSRHPSWLKWGMGLIGLGLLVWLGLGVANTVGLRPPPPLNSDVSAGLEEANKILETHPRNFNALYQRAVSLYTLNQLEMSGAAYQLAVEVEPRAWFAWNNLANVLRDRGDFIGAEAAYTRSLKLNPRQETVYRNLGDLYLLRPDMDRAYGRQLAIDITRQGLGRIKDSELLQSFLDYLMSQNDQG